MSPTHRRNGRMCRVYVTHALTLALCTGVIASCDSLSAQTILEPGVAVETVVSGLSAPTGIAFIGDGDFFVIEKGTGKVKRVTNGAVAAEVLDLPVNANSERGLLGITLHPNFATNGYVYLYYSRAEADNETWIENRVSRFTWDGTSLTDETLIIAFPSSTTQPNGPNHDGGIILFGPDGKLYGITGDLNRAGIEQNQSETALAGVGGVFRLNDDGSIPADNPFIAHESPLIQRLYAYGVRNSFGLTFDPLTDNLWDTENGPASYDEVNLVPRGFNSGWSQIMGPDSRDPQDVSDLTQLPGSVYLDPKLSFFSPVAVTAIIFIHESTLPDSWGGTLVMGDSNTGNLYRFELNAARDTLVLTDDLADLVADTNEERNALRIGTGFGTTTDLEIGPDGHLYIVSISGVVRRLLPSAMAGDANCDGMINVGDILPFALALVDPASYAEQFPSCSTANADLNDDDLLDSLDIPALVAILLSQ